MINLHSKEIGGGAIKAAYRSRPKEIESQVYFANTENFDLNAQAAMLTTSKSNTYSLADALKMK